MKQEAKTPFSDVTIDESTSGALDLSPFLTQAPSPTAVARRPAPRMDWYEPPSPKKLPSQRLLGQIGEDEPQWKRWAFLLLAIAIAGGYFFFLKSYVASGPGRLGIDENAYLVGGSNFADHKSTGFKPPSDYAYAGLMWVQSPKNGWFYPKYPFGQSILYAIALKLGGASHGVDLAFLINPLCTSLALLAMFLMTRAVAGSFWGLLSMFLLGFGYTTLNRSIDPDSHASTLLFVLAGMFLLLRWWQTGSIWRGVLAGLLLGCAVTIRYNEAMLLFPLFQLDHFLSDTAWWKVEPKGHWLRATVLLVKAARFLPIGPLGIAAILSIRWNRWTSYFRAAVPIIAWAIPVGLLVEFNRHTLGVNTGYDLTHESEGFTTTEFLDKWQFAIHQVYSFGLFLVLPLGVAGMAFLFRRSWRAGLFFTLWFVPGTLLYIAYYWGNHMPGVGYLRFFLTFFPAMIATAMWLLCEASHAVRSESDSPKRRGSIAVPLGGGILTAGAAAIGLMICQPSMELELRHNTDIAFSTDNIVRAVHRDHPTAAETPIFFCDEGFMPHLLEHLPFVLKGDWYSADAFDLRFNGAFGAAGFLDPKKGDKSDQPVQIQQDRIERQVKLFTGKTGADLVAIQHQMLAEAIEQNRPVYAILTPTQLSHWKSRFLTDGFESKVLDHWTEPCAVPSEESHGPLAPSGFPDWYHRGRQELSILRITRSTHTSSS